MELQYFSAVKKGEGPLTKGAKTRESESEEEEQLAESTVIIQ